MNELQAAYDNSRATQISHLVTVPAGLFAVVCESPDHCWVTDATLPHPRRSIVSLHGSRKIAEHIARKLDRRAAAQEDYESGYVVFPRNKPARVAVVVADYEIPF